MTLYPAIDLKGGQCVRLRQGDMGQATVYGRTPADQALFWQDQGFRFLHVVDLDGAFSGRSENVEAVRSILETVSIPVQLGGGVRTLEAIDFWLSKGITRVILGTVAVTNPALVEEAGRLFDGRIVVGLDAKGGYVATQGWAETSRMRALEMAKRFEGCGVAALIYTDIERDGMFAGLNWEATRTLAEGTSLPVIASGGLSSLEDLSRLKDPRFSCVSGAILGRALYEERLDPRAAVEMFYGKGEEKEG